MTCNFCYNQHSLDKTMFSRVPNPDPDSQQEVSSSFDGGQFNFEDDSDWWSNAIEEDFFDSPMPFDASEFGLWNGRFPPPPPRPPFLDEDVASDGLTTCDLCTWAWSDRGAYSLDGSIGEAAAELGWAFTLIIVSIISALLGAIIMVVVLRCKRKEMDSEAETISLDGKLFEASVDSDTTILSDSELEKEMENVNIEDTTIISEDVSEEEDDNINVTIREIKAPQPECPDPNVKPADIPEVKGKRGTRLESAIVIRKDRARGRHGTTQRSSKNLTARNGNGKQADLRTMMAKVASPKSTTGNKSSKRHRSPSSTRKGKETNEQPRKQFKDRQAINTPKHPAQDRLNRMRKDMAEDDNQPIHRSATNDISLSSDESPNAHHSAGKEVAKMPTYGEVAGRTLKIKIGPTAGPQIAIILPKIRKFLEDKIFDAVMDDTFTPTFMENNRIGKDGLYLHCTDFSSAEWIRNTMTAASEFKESRIVVVPQEEEINFKPQSSHVRVKACVPMRKSGEEILKTMAKLNKHLNTEKWHIKRIIPNGTVKSTLYIRMDIPSFEVIKSQNNQINWILGTIEIRQERYGNKPRET
ncbi:hypothetical protein Bhyg_08481 [Pseudolycoriella hygida]|uniref:DUF4780 domain-containing protein n=1 Tax=Pseudolycoriella hygida TaxID=35572 RepID=A0A9Q0N4S9_9DIPT|nr:hypothetical protein Bhyg_08481 [Pseudolycoriella hygida]